MEIPENSGFRHFSRERPDVVLSIEEKVRRDEEKKAQRREEKLLRRQAETAEKDHPR